MNDIQNNERNEQMVRVLAMVGFVVMICLLAWLAVQAVRFIPTAFSSLATIFEANQRDYADQTGGHHPDEENVVVTTGDTDTDADTDIDLIAVNTADDGSDTKATAPATTTISGTNASAATSTANQAAKPAPVQYKTVTTYKVPVSDPNGYTDLAVSFSAAGSMTAANRFVPNASLDRDDYGAIQFVVKNTGTKTSGTWTFKAELPDGNVLNSKVQSPLKPGESSTLTVVFGNAEKRGNRAIGATVYASGDINAANNSFRTTVSIK